MLIVLLLGSGGKALCRGSLRKGPRCDQSVELAPPNVYDAKYVKWSIADLPILPQKWQYLVSASTKKQFGILQKLMHRPDVDSMICATDAGQCGWVT